jgi:hypothetical protein
MSSFLPGLGRALAVMREITTALLAALAPSLGCAFAVLCEISTAVLAARASSHGCAFAVLCKIPRTTAMFGFRISHLPILGCWFTLRSTQRGLPEFPKRISERARRFA